MHLKRVATCTLVLCLVGSEMFARAQMTQKPDTAKEADKAESTWWQSAVIYEIYPRSFQDTNGDGIGDLNGITMRLDYLKDLGVDAIWLTPVYPSPQVDFGYDISDYKNIDSKYGTLADFDRLVAEAKRRQIRVIMDMVMNHTSDQHKWFLESRSSRGNPYRDWYMWHDGKDETPSSKGEPPNNWQSVFGHSAWQWDEQTRQYYYHKYYIQQPDLNWNNPEVHRAFDDIMRFWLERGVGGFRFDAITSLFEDPGLGDERVVLDASGKPMMNAYGDPQLDHSKTSNLPGLHAVVAEMRATADEFNSVRFPGSRVLIGEAYLPNVSELKKMYGTASRPEFQLPMDTQVGFINKLDVAAFRSKLNEAEAKLGSGIPLLLFDNHDRPRLDLRYGDGAHDTEIQRVIATILLASRGAALMYYGDEIGMKTTPPQRKEDVKDPIGITGWPLEKGRDGERTPMQWNGGAQAGFTTGKPWLPISSSASMINVQTEENDPDSLLTWYRSLIRLKKKNSAIKSGTSRMLDTNNSSVLSWERYTPGSLPVVVSVNFTAKAQTVNLAADVKGSRLQTLLKSPAQGDPATLDHIELAPFGVYMGEVDPPAR